MKKLNIILMVVCLVLGGALFFFFQGGGGENLTSSSPSPSPSPTAEVQLSPGPTPGLIVDEVKDADYWARLLDPESRYFVLFPGCEKIYPSNVTFKNDIVIMLDNRLSDQPQTLRIGDRSFDLEPRGWYLTTLHSSKLPARLTMFCGSIELGQIDLE
ncbi:MAG: hypothetical protein A3B99_02220 [Candidatus Yanofskybacteria bacterium RIFCSPHIGHO2_02_FULL_44_12b]|uniref:Uncharacterized protein n=2 Tax=Candidatus Yanofskyibacteriota TaxID=1752733 RepID=A0A1F8GNE0_9BACT|nr:MAG: hypothetical protein UW79_C0012G0036 [Candidatus Yanofskybacteria bacterium GW2011_GWA2_44_9]OGN05216.1 MAG: hypothetical protein A2659_04295 [Candidatus Yanofskybacteria bacterium RIFCSPHIGHO2_01_FULL_44_24]OGN15274.1 MAG: hypothetical protein A3B99_02220 [Candidatus Yanofskybacteria bacterium RIFCSPHIGHO2_02_FULL_44_12b]OGN26937.1 MAG: hypothetical protein A2925_01555 [Candidatus Yanofskybacteria bacterium RIFCSPLOWO2_01_FULL_44_22]